MKKLIQDLELHSCNKDILLSNESEVKQVLQGHTDTLQPENAELLSKHTALADEKVQLYEKIEKCEQMVTTLHNEVQSLQSLL